MNLARALRMEATAAPILSMVGAGGKTTALFQLAQQLQSLGYKQILVSATSHLGLWQIPLADQHLIAENTVALKDFPKEGVTLITGSVDGERTRPVSETTLNWLREVSNNQKIPLLIEADGSRQKPLKAPAEHEPPIPTFTEQVLLITGLGALGQPLDETTVHRAEIFSQLTGLEFGQPITPRAVTHLLSHPSGGLKNIPTGARRIALLNQADTPELHSMGGGMARELLGNFDTVLVGSLEKDELSVFEKCAGVILAAGESSRYGMPKQLLDWKGKPFIRHVTETALRSGLEPVVVITGRHHAEIESHLKDLPVNVIRNPDYAQGQSTSIKKGVSALPKIVGGAVFLLADQPQIPADVIRALTEAHTRSLSPILAPLVLEERRANPVLFDRSVFPDLMQLTGDTGGRAIFSKHPIEYIPWHDDILLFDVDQPEDYEKLKRLDL